MCEEIVDDARWTHDHPKGSGKLKNKNENLTIQIFATSIFNIRYKAMIFFCIKTTKHLDIRRDIKKFSPVGCCTDKRQKSRGTVKIRFTG